MMFPDKLTFFFLVSLIISCVFSNQQELFLNAEFRCERINISFCQNIGYNETIMPNLLNHQKQSEVASDVHVYYPVLKIQCSPDIRFFICSLYVPMCTVLEHPILPCRSLCISARNGCESLLKSFGHSWPENLNCDKFPLDKTDVLCVSKNNNDSESNVNNMYSNLNSVNTVYNSYYSNNFHSKSTKGLDNLTLNNKEFNFTCPDHLKLGRNYDYSLKVGSVVTKNCGLPCHGMFFSTQEKQFLKIWIVSWSTVCVISCLFTVLTFIINTSRFRYPERPIIFLAVCYLMISMIYIFGFLSGDSIACRKPLPPPSDKPQLQTVSTISFGTKKEACTLTFIVLYFFTMASSLWWVILAFTWFLAAGLKWGHEAIEANSQYFHFIAWAIPAFKTMIILAMGKIEGDVLSGICFVGLWNPDILLKFVLVPMLVYLVVGIIFLFLGFISLIRIRNVMKHDGSKTDKLEKLMLRIGIFSVLYTVPAIIVLSCLFYEEINIDSWMITWHRSICKSSDSNSYLIRCPADGLNKKPNFLIFLLKYLSSLIVGITLNIWIWSNKTVSSWKEFLIKICGRGLQSYV